MWKERKGRVLCRECCYNTTRQGNPVFMCPSPSPLTPQAGILSGRDLLLLFSVPEYMVEETDSPLCLLCESASPVEWREGKKETK